MKRKAVFLVLSFFVIFTIVFLNNEDEKVIKKSNENLTRGKIDLIATTNCSANFAIWIVTSYAGNGEKRNQIRESYRKTDLEIMGIQRVFLLGKIEDENSTVEESSTHEDIIQGDFIEAYKNLTYKHLMGLNWVSENCPEKVFVMKMDDDIIINIFEVAKLLDQQKPNDSFIMGHILEKMVPIRDPESKWFVTKPEFDKKFYPDFVSGWFYMTNRKTVKKLVKQSQNHSSLFWIDDVYVTGILREKSETKIIDIHEKFATDYRFLECCIKDGFKKRVNCEILAGPDGAQKDLLRNFTQFSKFCLQNKCSPRSPKNYVAKKCVWTYKEGKKFSNPGNAIVKELNV